MESYNAIVNDLRKDALSLRARLQSIIYDNRFVSMFDNYPLIANERCGLWYVQPHQLHDSVYFKSTDGHTSHWKFSLRRLNFHLLPLIGRKTTVVVVDSTRKGKLMPDALLKTIPIWCAVLNYIMYEGDESDEFRELQQDNWLVTPREMVSQSEHHSIVAKIPEFAREVTKLNLTSKKQLVESLGSKKPLVPQWLYPGKEEVNEKTDCFNVCCLTASEKHTSPKEWNYPLPYVQGAADDHELWATKDILGGKLDQNIFWDEIYYEPEEDLRVVDMATGDLYPWLSDEQLIRRIELIHENCLEEEGEELMDSTPLGDTGIHLGKISSDVPFNAISDSFAEVIVLSSNFKVTDIPEKTDIAIKLHKVESSKKGSKQLRDLLPEINKNYAPGKTVLVLCDTGTDLGAGVCLCFLSKWYTLEWQKSDDPLHVNKDIVKQHLSKIQNFHKVNPSRNTLQSVNTYLMGGGG